MAFPKLERPFIFCDDLVGVNSLRMGVFLFIDGPALVCGSVNFPILWPHTPVQTKLKCPQGGLNSKQHSLKMF